MWTCPAHHRQTHLAFPLSHPRLPVSPSSRSLIPRQTTTIRPNGSQAEIFKRALAENRTPLFKNYPFCAASAPFGFANAIIMKPKTSQNVFRRLPAWFTLTVGVVIGIIVSKLLFSSVACLPAFPPHLYS